MKIYIELLLKDQYKKMLRDAAKEDELFFKDELQDEQKVFNAIQQAEIIFGNPKPATLLEKAQNLQWMQLSSTGFDGYSSVHTNAVVTNLKDYFAQPCAETAIAGIMALYRGIDQFSILKTAVTWIGTPIREGLQLLLHKKVIILGAGGIGKQVAKILSGFDCDISFYARSAPEATIKTPEQLETALPDADIVIGCLPGTTQTKGLFTNRMISLMKPASVFCNVGRGNLLEDENALIQALMNKKIGGAVLDVTAQEPLPADHPLWKCPNIILSQHTGGGNITEYEGMIDFFLENLAAYKQKKPLQNQVKLSRGY
ncbi:MAG: D-2-hydroxyacid dehydrogenase [Agriterribacter sp.]